MHGARLSTSSVIVQNRGQCSVAFAPPQANAVRKKHAEDMADVLLLWSNEESIMRAFSDADFNDDDALHLCKS